MDPGWVGEMLFLCAVALIHAGAIREKTQKERSAVQVVLVELLSVSDLSLRMQALKLYFPGQSREHTKTT